MTNNDGNHYLEELKYNLQTRDKVKIEIVLKLLPQVDLDTQRQAVLELMRADFNATAPAIARIVGLHPELLDTVPVFRDAFSQNMIDCPSALVKSLMSNDYEDKTVFIDMAKELALEEAIPALKEILHSSKNEHEIQQAILALGEVGEDNIVTVLSEFLYSRSRDLSIAAVKALGQIGTEVALQQIANRMGTDTGLDLLIMNVLARIQNNIALEKLNEALGASNTQLRNYAKSKLVEIGEKAVPSIVEGLHCNDEDRVIHTLNVLADIGDQSSVLPVRKLLQHHPENPNIRFAAYEALGCMPVKTGAFTLTAGLMDPVDHVAVAAARAIDKNYCDILENGLKNLIGENVKETERYAELFIISEADQIILSLAEDKTFIMTALNYLKNKAAKDDCEHYENLLREKGFTKYADMLRPAVEEEEKTEGMTKVWAVDDSRMMLAIYKNVLHSLGYDAKLFEFPESAIEEFNHEQPDLLLTDLNMPKVSGIELTKAIRKHDKGKKLPIIMITTQSDAKDDNDVKEAGVTDVLWKPFTNEGLSEAIQAHLKAAAN